MSAENVEKVRAKTQLLLVEFLRADLKLAFTFLMTAKIDIDRDPEHARQLCARVWKALDSIRKLSSGIRNHAEQEEIHRRADKLEFELRNISLWG